MSRLLKMIEFVEHHSIDERVYLKLYSKDNSTKPVEIMWERGSDQKPWKIRTSDSIQWQYFENHDLVSQLSLEGVSLEEFEAGLKNSILSQAIYADYYYRQAQKILGPEVINKSKKDTENFLAGLANVINQRSEHKSVFTRSTTFKSKRSTSHLSLIKPEDDRRNRHS